MDKFPLDDKLKALSEEEIIASCQAGNLEAFNVLISRYENRVLNLTLRYLRDYHMAVEESQEIFVKIFQKIRHFRGDSAFSSWLFRVTSNHCFTVLHREKRKQAHFHHVALDEAHEEGMESLLEDSHAPKPDEVLARTEMHDAIAKALDLLPPDQRQAIILFHYENLNYVEMSEIMRMPASTVASCLYRARRNLKNIFLNQRGGEQK